MFKKTSKILLTLLLAAFMMLSALPVQAKVSKEQADRLKKDLTPVGAERAGNADGTIPPWTGGLSKIPEGIHYDPTGGKMIHPDPYADDKILFTITAQNMDQYTDKLSPGVQALLKKYPDTYKLHVYPTRRSFACKQKFYDNTYLNALEAELVNDGFDGFTNAFCGVPFPVTDDGMEMYQNYSWGRWWGESYSVQSLSSVVFPSGARSKGGLADQKYKSPYYGADGISREEFDPTGRARGLFMKWLAPPRRKGEMLLVLDPIDYTYGRRAAWQYFPGQRRVRRAPNIGYDTPNPSSGQIGTYDDAFMINGRMDRFEFEYLGKKEMFIPYNCYKQDLSTADELHTAYHRNPDVTRWELHRVHVNELTLRDGYRHCYHKIQIFQDEDSWIVAVKDKYDSRGALWRVSVAGPKQHYDGPFMHYRVSVHYDLTIDNYAITGSINGLETPSRYDADFGDGFSFFTPQNLRKVGKR